MLLRVCAWVTVCLAATAAPAATELDRIVVSTNRAKNVKHEPQPVVNDDAFLRRVYVDLICRIPTEAEIREFASWPAKERREKLIDKLMADDRFNDRWTIFFEDMMRLRSQASGGQALIAYVHESVKSGQPYDELVRRLISTNGKAGKTPEVGFVLGDDADPLQMASVTSQVFLGVRIGCAQCHDHPFDVWKQKDFYDLAAFFGRTKRYESELTKVVYTIEMEKSTVLWPPEGKAPNSERKPLAPRFPFGIEQESRRPDVIKRLASVRAEKAKARELARRPSLDDLLATTDDKVKQRASGKGPEGAVTTEAKTDIRKIDIQASLSQRSVNREELAKFVTNPGNRYFSRSLVNRVWKTLIGRGFVEPVDDFREDNPAAHDAALDYLSSEFVASDYNLRTLVRLIVTSDAYQRGHAPRSADELTRQEMETQLVATPMRRMISEALFDSIVTAGRLFTPKHSPGKNEKVITEIVRVPKGRVGELSLVPGGGKPAMAAPSMAMAGPSNGSAYALENAIEVDFKAVLAAAQKEDDVALDKMKVMSAEELQAMRVAQDRPSMKYEQKSVSKVIDDNPTFPTSLRMQSPAPEGHFLRVFGQPNRSDLGDLRDDTPSMRQALMMLNGRLTHEASRVGDLEPAYKFVSGKQIDVDAAIRLSYLEIMTRVPSAEEISDAKEIIGAASSPLEGLADLRWVLLNGNEFRFLP